MTGFHRSSSLPAGPSPNCEFKKQAAAAYRMRSTSLPCRPHSLISQIQEEISYIRTWQSQHVPSCTSLEAGMGRIEVLHGALEDLLGLPQSQQSLQACRSSSWAESLLDDFLCLADAYGRFRDTLVSLQQIQADAQAAIRRKDTSKLGSLLKAMRKAEKEIAKIGSALRVKSTSAGKSLEAVAAADVELVGILKDVKMVISSASAAVFSGLAAFSVASCSSGSSSWTSMLKNKLTSSKDMGNSEWESKLKGLKELEKCITNLENGSERVFKCLIKTRVSLLNTLTP